MSYVLRPLNNGPQRVQTPVSHSPSFSDQSVQSPCVEVKHAAAPADCSKTQFTSHHCLAKTCSISLQTSENLFISHIDDTASFIYTYTHQERLVKWTPLSIKGPDEERIYFTLDVEWIQEPDTQSFCSSWTTGYQPVISSNMLPCHFRGWALSACNCYTAVDVQVSLS